MTSFQVNQDAADRLQAAADAEPPCTGRHAMLMVANLALARTETPQAAAEMLRR
jgi:hypothetical protein